MTMRRFAGVLCLLLAGCATATIEDAVPPSALADADSGTAQATGPAAGQAPAGGTYPNLNAEPAAAAPQITAEQKASETAALRARRQQLAGEGGGQAVGTSAEDLRRLAQSHGEEALKQIESE